MWSEYSIENGSQAYFYVFEYLYKYSSSNEAILIHWNNVHLLFWSHSQEKIRMYTYNIWIRFNQNECAKFVKSIRHNKIWHDIVLTNQTKTNHLLNVRRHKKKRTIRTNTFDYYWRLFAPHLFHSVSLAISFAISSIFPRLRLFISVSTDVGHKSRIPLCDGTVTNHHHQSLIEH